MHFQLPTTYPWVASVNQDILNQQKQAELEGVTNAAALALTDAASGYPGDPNKGTINTGSKLDWDTMTGTQQLCFIQWGLSQQTGVPFAAASIPDDVATFIRDNPGPVETWNWSYVQCGIVPNTPGLLPIRDVMPVGTVTRITGQLLPTA